MAALLGLAAAAAWKACGPDFYRAVFSYLRHPDLPRTEFIDGRLGVLQPTFARSYLVIAYRYLNGIGLNPREREQARDYYKDRGTSSWDNTGINWPARWRALRSQIKSPVPPQSSLITGGQLAYDPETHTFDLNCADDAFRVAVHTLEARRVQFALTSRAFRSWLSAQDAVFRNCDSDHPEIPQPAASDLPPVIRADREYQIAAANFYAGKYDAAIDQFRRISRDPSSPWRTISHYLVLRTLFRDTDDDQPSQHTIDQIRIEGQTILADPGLASIHGMTWNLLNRAGVREADPAYFRDLAHLLSSKGQDNGLREELWNYTTLYDHIIGAADPNAIFPPAKPSPVDASHFRDADLTDWIFSYQARDTSSFSHSIARWRETHSAAWLLAALSRATPANDTAALLQSAAAVPASSPAYLTARFHLLRLEEENGNKSTARNGLDAVLASPALSGLPSSTNLFRGLRMRTAPTLDDFLKYAVRRPVLVTIQLNFGEEPHFWYEEQIPARPKATDLFDADATRVLNRQTPFRFLREAALNGSLPRDLESEALIIAFTRGVMLGDDVSDIAKRLSANPDLTAFANAYVNENTAEGKRFAAAFLLLHRPEARPYFATGITRQSKPGRLDPYRDNWWCPMDIEAAMDSRANYSWYSETPNLLQASAANLTPDFLAGSPYDQARRELAKLGTLGAATDFLGGIVLPYAKSHTDDPRVPEALYWLVRAGHYGCADVNSWKTTRAAFQALQLRYPKTRWAKQTPVWIKNDFDIRQERKARESNN